MQDQLEKSFSVSVVSPVYRSKKPLDEYYRRLSAILSSISTDREIILLDDASPDHSWSQLQKLREQDARVKIVDSLITMAKKRPLSAASATQKTTLFSQSTPTSSVFPEDVPKFLERLTTGAEVVIGALPAWGSAMQHGETSAQN